MTVNTAFESLAELQQKKQSLVTSFLTRLVMLLDQMVNYKSGILVTVPDQVAKVGSNR